MGGLARRAPFKFDYLWLVLRLFFRAGFYESLFAYHVTCFDSGLPTRQKRG
jgi:hypothetical protein